MWEEGEGQRGGVREVICTRTVGGGRMDAAAGCVAVVQVVSSPCGAVQRRQRLRIEQSEQEEVKEGTRRREEVQEDEKKTRRSTRSTGRSRRSRREKSEQRDRQVVAVVDARKQNAHGSPLPWIRTVCLPLITG